MANLKNIRNPKPRQNYLKFFKKKYSNRIALSSVENLSNFYFSILFISIILPFCTKKMHIYWPYESWDMHKTGFGNAILEVELRENLLKLP